MTQTAAKISVIDPRGQPPPIKQTPMAPRLDTLDGKTVYVVDVNWPYTHQFTEELYGVLAEKFPGTSFVFRDKIGRYMEDDPGLWAEIKEKGDAVVLAVGH